MTVDELISVGKYTTKSGKPLVIGTGTGTKWQMSKRSNKEIKIHHELVEQLVLALNTGFTHIDSAEAYTTTPEIAAAMKESGTKREDIWITSKYSPGLPMQDLHADTDSPLKSLDNVLRDLKSDYVDLFLIHVPFFDPKYCKGQTIAKAWAEMIEAKKSGKARYIGVSNFAIPHLLETFKVAEGNPAYYPEFCQIENHAYLPNQTRNIVQFCQENGIVVEAYGPLTPLFRIKDGDNVITDHPLTKLLPELAAKYGKTEAQILLRHTLQKGILPITTSSKAERIRESLEVYGFDLSPVDMRRIDNEGAKFKFRGFFGEALQCYE